MRPGLLGFLVKVSAPVAQPQHQEFLDEHFSLNPAWKDFKRKLKSPSFVEAVKQDTRADEKLKRYSEANAQHLQARGVPYFRVPSQSSSKYYTVKYHPDNDRFSCNCGDWVHARSHQEAKRQKDCKHIGVIRNELKSQGVTSKDLVKKAAAGRAAAALLQALG